MQNVGIACLYPVKVNVADAAIKFCVIGYHQKVQWRIQLHSGAGARMNDRLARGKGIGRVRVSGLVAIQKRIERVGRVQMGITPQQLWRSVGAANKDKKQRQCAAFEQSLWFVTGHGLTLRRVVIEPD